MRKIDYDIGWNAGKVTVTARSARAKERTPETLTMDRDAAFDVVKRDEAEGYSFLGHEHVDKNRRPVTNGYFVIGTDGRLTLAGQDWGPSHPVYEEGDTLMGGPRNGKEAVIEKILTGDFAQKMGLGVVFVLKEREVSSDN
jgi:hypothetical protein